MVKQVIRATYIWLSGKDTYHDIRSKEKTCYVDKHEVRETLRHLDFTALYPVTHEAKYGESTESETLKSKVLSWFSEWNFDGSSTGQATGEDTEIIIRPAAVFRHPQCEYTPDSPTNFPRFVVLCECFYPADRGLTTVILKGANNTSSPKSESGFPRVDPPADVAANKVDGYAPTVDNTRARARNVFLNTPLGKQLKPWFGLEQEFIIMKGSRPIGWPERGFPAPQGPYYCGTGSDRVFGRDIIDRHHDLCIKMGIRISGTNAEVTPGQWEFQVGPCEGLDAGDHLIAARWLLSRVLEEYSERDGEVYTFDCEPKPIKGDWNGSGLHTNFSTTETRDSPAFPNRPSTPTDDADQIPPSPGGTPGSKTSHMMRYIRNLSLTVADTVDVYGANNHERLSGHHETSRFDEFSFGVGTRGTSIRIPNQVAKDNYIGYYEDRRPGGNADPYLVTATLFASSVGLPSEVAKTPAATWAL